MSDNEAKRKWEKPKLVALVRGGAEERVLQSCKNETVTFDFGPGDEHGGCTDLPPAGDESGWCVACEEFTS